jgi:hypothetical protein
MEGLRTAPRCSCRTRRTIRRRHTAAGRCEPQTRWWSPSRTPGPPRNRRRCGTARRARSARHTRPRSPGTTTPSWLHGERTAVGAGGCHAVGTVHEPQFQALAAQALAGGGMRRAPGRPTPTTGLAASSRTPNELAVRWVSEGLGDAGCTPVTPAVGIARDLAGVNSRLGGGTLHAHQALRAPGVGAARPVELGALAAPGHDHHEPPRPHRSTVAQPVCEQ